MSRLYTVTMTEGEIEHFKGYVDGYETRMRGVIRHPLRALLDRLGDDENGISDVTRTLILAAARSGRRQAEHVEYHSPNWLIQMWPAEGGWGGRGTLQFAGMGHAVSVRGTTAEDVLDQILDFHACGPNRNLAEGKGFPVEGEE